jgi:hypothetical protein
MEALDSVARILRHRGRPDLADLLSRSHSHFEESNQYGSLLNSTLTTVEISAPIDEYDRLKALGDNDRSAILNAFLEFLPPKAHGPELSRVEFFLDTTTLVESGSDSDSLLREIESQRTLMADVATGGPRIQEVDAQYMARRALISKQLVERGLEDPNPFNSLWDWYAKWSKDLGSYQLRREYLSSMYKPVIDQVRTPPGAARHPLFEAGTGWTAIDKGQVSIRKLLASANTTEQFQSVGLFCRELLITLGQTVFDASKHPTTDGQKASATDAKRMLEAYFAAEAPGAPNEGLRKHARAAFDLANDLQHRRTATFRQAALCAEATTSVVNLIAIVSGRRDPQPSVV